MRLCATRAEAGRGPCRRRLGTVLRVLLPLILTVIMVFSIIDIATIDGSRVRHLPKPLWILLVILLSLVGSILWWGIGRAPREARSLGRYANDPPAAPPRPQAKGPDDDPDFLRSIDKR